MATIKAHHKASLYVQENDNIAIQTIDNQTMGERQKDEYGNKWIVFMYDDSFGDYTAHFKTKKAACAYALELFEQLA